MKRILASFFVLLSVAGCAPRYTEYYAYTDSGVEKPRVAIVPVLDSTGAKPSWDVSDEVIFGLRRQMCSCGKFYPLPQADVNAQVALLGRVDYFGTNLQPWAGFSNARYVVLVELVEHQVVPFERGSYTSLYPTNGAHSNEVLEIKAHLRILDVRNNSAKLALDEIIESNHLLPWGHDKIDYQTCGWDTEQYPSTPIGLAHNRLIYQISKRIDAIIGDCN